MVGAAAMMVEDFAVTEHGRARINPGTSGERAVGVAGTLELADYTVVIADGSQLAARTSRGVWSVIRPETDIPTRPQRAAVVHRAVELRQSFRASPQTRDRQIGDSRPLVNDSQLLPYSRCFHTAIESEKW